MPGGATSHVSAASVYGSPHLLCRGLASFDPPLVPERDPATVHHIPSYDNGLNLPYGRWPIYIYAMADTHLNCATDGLSHAKKEKEKKEETHRRNTGTRVEKMEIPCAIIAK